MYDQVRNKLSIRFDPLGQQRVKNVGTPVMSYRVVQHGAGREVRSTQAPPNPVSHGKSGLARAWDRYLNLPQPIAVIIAIAAFLFIINVFSGLDSIWFHWAVAPHRHPAARR